MMSKGENKKRYCKESEEELKKAYRENPRPELTGERWENRMEKKGILKSFFLSKIPQNVCMGLEISRRFLMVLRLLVRAGLLPMDLQ